MTSLNWGPLYLVLLPMATLLTALLLRSLQGALASLDPLLQPVGGNTFAFTEVLAARFRRAWKVFVFPACLVAATGLTLLADYRDIVAPVGAQLGISASGEPDWSTGGAGAHPDRSPLLYLAFNVAAFTAQAFSVYCGFLILCCAGYPLYIVASQGLDDPSVRAQTTTPPDNPRAVDIRNHFAVRWDYCGPHGRCGLHRLDRVYTIYVVAILVAVAAAYLSIKHNANAPEGADLGSRLLVIGTLLLLPAAFAWFLLCYFTNFPSSLPPEFKEKGCPEPKPWPLGNEKLAWALMGIAATWWIATAKLAFDVFSSPK